MSFKKEDLLLVVRSRCLPLTSGQLKTQSVEQLTALLGEISLEEKTEILTRQESRLEYSKLKVDDLKLQLRARGLPVTGTKTELIDRLLASTSTATAYDLDESQKSILESCDDSLQIINAGPGSGKTSTLASLSALMIRKNPKSRVLVLTYNRNARVSFKSKLKLFSGTVSIKTKILSNPGLFVVTFDEYIYHARLAPLGYREFESYRDNFEYGLTLPLHPAERYDYLIIDEAQDLLPHHVALFEQLKPRSDHVVIAGDPRQEIYTGSGWFSRLWIDASPEIKKTLKYNHRATPELVELINRFSEKHFPKLHYKQMASRVSEGNYPKFVLVKEELPTQVAEFMMKGSSNAYCLSPVTTERFNTDAIITSLRQAIHEIQPGTTLHVTSSPDIPGMAIGNSYNYKGSERSAVYVIQSDLPYTDYGVPEVAVLKLIYVAISRARDNLMVFLTHPPAVDELWHGLVPPELQISTFRPRNKVRYQTHLSVTDDLARLECWVGNKMTLMDTFSAVNVEVKQDADFVGINVEMFLAKALGVASDYTYEFRASPLSNGRLAEAPGMFVDTIKRHYDVVFDPRTCGTDFSSDLQRLTEASKTNPEYTRAVVKISASSGKIWTVSERLMDEQLDVQSVVEKIRDNVSEEIPIHGERMQFDINCHRSNELVGVIVGEADFTWDDSVVEVKHAVESLPRHGAQARIYGCILNKPLVYVVNTKKGELYTCVSLKKKILHDATRAIFALKASTIASARLPSRVKMVADSLIYISVDLEYIGNTIYEVGAVAYQPATDRVFGVYHRIWRETKATDNQKDPFEVMTGLRKVSLDDPSGDQERIRSEFSSWVSTMTVTPTFVYWGSDDNDLQLLQVKTEKKINAMKIFRIWLENIGEKRNTKYSLSDAVSQCFGPIPFVPHRAFEDAVLTASVLNAVSDIEGSS
jgi:hypothetical protein